MTSYSINLLFINEHQCLESSLYTLLVAMSGKPPASFQVVKNNLCLKGMHKTLIHYRSGLLQMGLLSPLSKSYQIEHRRVTTVTTVYSSTWKLVLNNFKHPEDQ